MKFTRIQAGLYRAGGIEIRDQYSQDGATQSRSIVKNGKRWAIFRNGLFAGREHTLADAKEFAQAINAA